MAKPGWGYHYTPCNRGGGWGFAVAVVGGALLLGRVAKPAARAADGVGRALLTGLEIAGVVAGCVAGLAVVYVAARVALRVRRWHAARAAAAPPAVAAETVAGQLPAGQRRALEAPPRVVVLPAGDHAERARRLTRDG